MAGYGLLDPEMGYEDSGSYFLARKSVMGKRELAKVERKSRKMYEWATRSGDEEEDEERG